MWGVRGNVSCRRGRVEDRIGEEGERREGGRGETRRDSVQRGSECGRKGGKEVREGGKGQR